MFFKSELSSYFLYEGAFEGREAKLETYERLKEPTDVNEEPLMKVFSGISCRRYRECCEMIPEVFGLSASTVSKRFREASEQKLSGGSR